MSDTPRLGELELAVMEYIWRHGPEVTVPDVHGHLIRKRELAYTTVMTVMSRLFEKGILDRIEDQRPYRYSPTLTRDDYSARLMLDVLEEFGDSRAVLTRFVERIHPQDAAILRELAKKAGKGRGR